MVLYLEFIEIESRPLNLHEILWVLGCSGAQAGGGVAFLSGAQAPERWLNWALGCRRGNSTRGKESRNAARRARGGCRGVAAPQSRDPRNRIPSPFWSASFSPCRISPEPAAPFSQAADLRASGRSARSPGAYSRAALPRRLSQTLSQEQIPS